MKNELTKVDLAIRCLEKRGSVRTPEIAKAMSCNENNVSTLLRRAVDSGVILVCKVGVPNKDGSFSYKNEYRLSASAPKINSWILIEAVSGMDSVARKKEASNEK
jgi:DNA-binding Lrp family transcriptional regulator